MRLYSLCSRSCAPTAALWPPDTQSYLLSTVTDRDTLSYTFQTAPNPKAKAARRAYRDGPRHSEAPTKANFPPPVRIFMAVAAKCA